MGADPETGSRFGTFLKASGKLAAARQLSALLFVGAVLVLPLLVSGAWATDFVWAYFSMLTLTSLLGLGFERLAGAMAVGGDDAPLGSLLAVRLASVPFVGLAQWALLAFVGVSLTPTAWVATLAWTVAALVGPTAFAALRTHGNTSIEPATFFAMRVAQMGLLLGLAAAGAGVGAALAAVALCEAVGVAVGFRAVGPSRFRGFSPAGVRALPWQQAAWLAGVEVLALAYLRADLLLVGRILGPTLGATYAMLYRVVDGLNGAVGSAGLWLYADAVQQTDAENNHELRDRALRMLPPLAVGVGVVLVVAGALFTGAVPRLAGETRTLELLIAAFPLLTVNTIELHVRSGQQRNRSVVVIGGAALALNVALCLVLIPWLGLVGAALALVGSELLQSALLVPGCAKSARGTLLRAIAVAVAGAVLLFALGAVLDGEWVALGALIPAAGVVTALLLATFGGTGRRQRGGRSASASRASAQASQAPVEYVAST